MNSSSSDVKDSALQLFFDESRAAWRISDGQAIMIHTETSAYYSLNKTATYIFVALFAKAESPDDCADVLSKHFEHSREAVAEDLYHFLGHLHAEDLLIRGSAGSSQTPGEARTDTTLPPTYEKPALTRHGELETLILSSE